jgi:polyphosphate kinase 2 (PPK2 family)
MNHLDLNNLPSSPPEGTDRKEIEKKTKKLQKKLFQLQNLLFAEGKHALLVVLQGMDTSGKDGTVRHVFSCMNPMGVQVHSFKAPTEEEKKHDFLWRVYPKIPAKGMINVFNRSHYEDILVPTVHKTMDPERIERRYKVINDFETHLKINGTHILRCFCTFPTTSKKPVLQRDWQTLRSDGNTISPIHKNPSDGMITKPCISDCSTNVINHILGLPFLLTRSGIVII